MSNLNKIIVIYQYSFCFKACYICLTASHLRKRIEEHIPKTVENLCFSDKKDDMPDKVLNAYKRSSTAKHEVNISICANSYNVNRLKTF